jgi:predicted SAM-dependent methyltransferase
MRGILRATLPGWFKDALIGAMNLVLYYGKRRRCPVCGKSSRRFLKYGLALRKDAECGYCGSLERHRFLWVYLTKKTDLFTDPSKKMLHVAPELCLSKKFQKILGDNYITADLMKPAKVRMDITHIEFSDQSFDHIYCSHVLEHVVDDKRAIKEFYRILKPDGWAILLVPITAVKTFEDPSIVDPEERLKAFGQANHVRRYGPDYVDRLREAGFHVQVTLVNDLVDQTEATRMGLTVPPSGEIYFCTK